MAALADHKSQALVKLLVVADSGFGKTGALASLAKAGYNLRIIDFDNGLDVLRNLLASDPSALARVEYETFTDKFKNINGNLILDGQPKAFADALRFMSDWPGHGPLNKWTDKDVLVIDTLTTMGLASMRHILALTGRDGKAQIQDWGAAMDQIERVVQLLATKEVNCNVILNCHIQLAEAVEGSGVYKGYPAALGNKLSPKIPIYFNNCLVGKASGIGATKKRVFMTRGDGMVEGKSSNLNVPPELPQDSGLADFFKILRGSHPV